MVYAYKYLECLAESGQSVAQTTTANEENKYRQIFKLREMHLLAFFVLVYVGTEVTLGGMEPFDSNMIYVAGY